MNKINFFFFVAILVCLCNDLFAQAENEQLKNQISGLEKQITDLQHTYDQIMKQNDDILWFERVGSMAFIDKVYITGPAQANVKNPTAMGAKNPLKFYCYIFIPKDIEKGKKYPVIVLPHGGVHADFTTYHTHIVREMIYQQYIVVAPEYRGSTGYGKSFFDKIDYGGLEIEDVNAARDYVVENYDMADKNRVGIAGWSHGGLLALMNVFNYPDDFQVCFAGVPVSDLVMRMGYYDDEYRDIFSGHIGKTAQDNLEEYKRRSPVWHVSKLKTPLLIHTNTNDDDVNYIEVEHLIQALKAEDKKFEYEIFKDVEGGHSFDRIDTKIGKEIRLKIYKFLAKELNPPRKMENIDQMNEAAYWQGVYKKN